MDCEEIINMIENKMKIIKNSVSFKGEWRIIKESDWIKLKEDVKEKYLTNYDDSLDLEEFYNE